MNPIEWCLNYFISLIFRFLPQRLPTLKSLESVQIVAHRGVLDSPGVRENSLASFELAVQNQIEAIEFDVRFTKDLVPVVNHDDNCGRLFNRSDMNISEINYKDLVSQIDILSLEYVVNKLGRKLHLMIEIKEDIQNCPDKVLILSQILQKLVPKRDYHLLTLNPLYLENLKVFEPSSIIDVIWLDGAKTFFYNERFGHGGVAGHFLFFDNNRISKLHEQGKKVGVGFIDSQNSLYRELNRGVDYIFTNHPLKLKRIVRRARQKALDDADASI